MRSMKWAAAAFVAALLVPSAAQASPVLRVGKDGTARVVNDRLLPPRARTALPAVPRGAAIARPEPPGTGGRADPGATREPRQRAQ